MATSPTSAPGPTGEHLERGHPAENPTEPKPTGGQPLGRFYTQDELVEVEINGVKHMMPKEAAEAYQSQLDTLMATNYQPDPEPEPEPNSTPDQDEEMAELMYTDPKEYTRRLTESIREDLKTEYSQDQQQRQFWSDFYSKHEDLNRSRDHAIVLAVMEQNMSALKGMDQEAASDKLAELTREKILAIASSFGAKSPKTKSETLESGPGPTPAPEPEPEPNVHSLSQSIKERRKRFTKNTLKSAS